VIVGWQSSLDTMQPCPRSAERNSHQSLAFVRFIVTFSFTYILRRGVLDIGIGRGVSA
jgi:hypothetical protein